MTSSAESFLASTNATISRLLQSPAVSCTDLNAIARHLCLSNNAKRARPLLCLYNYWLFDDKPAADFAHIGVAAEFIHAASLLHDDVVDDASKRRGLPSANALFGNAQAVLAGNYLLTRAFDLLRPFPRDLADRAITVVGDMAQSALLEINSRGSLELDENIWRSIARGKTGVLFGWCGFAAAICAKREHEAAKLWSIGQVVGHIFQMADDLKDFSGDSKLKDQCQDLRNREPSLPIILAQNSSLELKNIFKNYYEQPSLSEKQITFLRDQVFASGAISLTKIYMNQALEHVRDELTSYEKSLGKIYLDRWVQDLASCELEI